MASLLALMNSPDPRPVAWHAQGRAAAFPTYFPSGFTRGGSWVSWGRPHVSWPNRLLPGGAPGTPLRRPQPFGPSLARLPESLGLAWWEGSWLGRQPKAQAKRSQAVEASQLMRGLGQHFSSGFCGQGQGGGVKILGVLPSPVLILAV